ncbi:hypothetical protein WOLCODRAFT_62655 [Wolfiporia cocos MD-104 SS10]|uniref:Cyclin N-terminal domain-containing protein n=1 Tax=Wolfiporia cocos (strain MD-104) TaxID=742152 RepID=A0A2H3IT74_WOLCO|nr:hypothetical protein WOLCODRAFT_62655 [Wolfiporia cocos MD-104 SS10]
MANKFVDDNTYTNKTWSEVSGIDLTEINKMEKEFLLGIDFGLYVDEATYNSWLNLLQGLVMAKEREQQRWRRSKRPARSLHRGYHLRHFAPSRAAALHSTSYRARSSSPRQYTIDVPAATAEMHARSVVSPTSGSSQYAAAAACGSKRSASDAFHPYSETPSFAAAQAPAPRRSMGLTLQIPELDYSSGTSSESSASPMDLQSFSRMSLRASPVDGQHGSPWATTVGQEGIPQTLASAYRVDHKRSYVVPQHLYYYTLACSPAEESSSRKGRLRYHYWQPPANSVPVHEFQLTMPTVVQSASASPYDMHVRLPAASALPPFSEISQGWTHRDESAPTCHIDTQEACLRPAHDAVPSAPFANAGPPGFQSYATPAPVPSPYYYQARGRRF